MDTLDFPLKQFISRNLNSTTQNFTQLLLSLKLNVFNNCTLISGFRKPTSLFFLRQWEILFWCIALASFQNLHPPVSASSLVVQDGGRTFHFPPQHVKGMCENERVRECTTFPEKPAVMSFQVCDDPVWGIVLRMGHHPPVPPPPPPPLVYSFFSTTVFSSLCSYLSSSTLLIICL